MPIVWKIDKIIELLNKMENDINYSTRVIAGDNKDLFIANARQIAMNGAILFKNGKINQLDLEQRNIAFENYNNEIDNILSCFPEFMDSKENGLHI